MSEHLEIDPEKLRFFERLADEGLALTFDDVRAQTRSGRDVEPFEPDLRSKFSRNVDLIVPFVSAAMDTVTDSRMAIAMAQMGGIGVIHAAMDPETQKREVRAVKIKLNGLIENPITVRADDPMQNVINEHGERGFHTFPVVDNNGKCVGVLTKRAFDFFDRTGTVRECMSVRENSGLITVESGTTIKQAYEMMNDQRLRMLPVLDNEGRVEGLYLWSDVKRIVRGNNTGYNVDEHGRLRVAAAVPTDGSAIDRVQEMHKDIDVVVIDSADGDSYYSFQTLRELKRKFPDLDVVVGNISNPDSARELAEEGADGIKVGQGPGSICSTRPEIGIGRPQVSAVYEIWRQVRDFGIPICADGGIREHGDVPIAIAVGASSVMMGNMLAGTDEAPGEIINLPNGARVKTYRGMGSASAMRESSSARNRYGGDNFNMPLPEGVEGYVPLKGPVADILDACRRALRKQMLYCKTKTIPDHQARALLDRITGAGLAESHPHSITRKN